MGVAGLVAEFNPLHNGHKYLIDSYRLRHPDDSIIAVMSGNITQRGELAVLDKWQRAEAAIHSGVDLVLELPVVYAVRSAQYFGYYAIQLLARLHLVDTIICGAEMPANQLMELSSNVLSTKDLSAQLQSYLNRGYSYASAMSKALLDIGLTTEDFHLPNSILALEYLKANVQLGSPFTFKIIERREAQHRDLLLNATMASGKALRQAMLDSPIAWDKISSTVPPITYSFLREVVEGQLLPERKILGEYLLLRLRQWRLHDVEEIYGTHAGMAQRILEIAYKASSVNDLWTKLKTKRYAYTHISRLLIYLALGLSRGVVEKADSYGASYARILAFSTRGQELLAKARKQSQIPLITKVSKFLNTKQWKYYDLNDLQECLSYDILATDFYRMCQGQWHNTGEDFQRGPLRLEVHSS